MKKLLLVLILCALALNAAAFRNEEKLEDPRLEAKAEVLFHEVRCVVCEGESLAESNADIAFDMRALIREKISKGESEEQIKKFLTERFGNGILQKPPFLPETYLLWLMPPFLLVIGLIVILKSYYGRRNRAN